MTSPVGKEQVKEKNIQSLRRGSLKTVLYIVLPNLLFISHDRRDEARSTERISINGIESGQSSFYHGDNNRTTWQPTLFKERLMMGFSQFKSGC
jgi:hypothetical protein